MRQILAAFAAAALLWPASADANPSEEMAQQIAGALRDSGQLSNYRVGVRYQDGTAWLLGSVTSDHQAAVAERLAARVNGVQRVINKIEVEGPAQEEGFTQAVMTTESAELESQAAPSPPQPSTVSQADLLLEMMEREHAAPRSFSPEQNATPAPVGAQPKRIARRGMPRPMRRSAPHQQQVRQANAHMSGYGGGSMPTPQGYTTGGAAGVSYDQANMPGYAWPSYAAYPNYSAVTYPKQYSPSAWPYIGPFYPYPQVPLGWRKVTLEWDDGWWFLDFSHQKGH